MNQEDREFLKQLQHEMLTQDTDYQADPRFWVIMQKEKEYWVEENIDGIFIYDCSNCEDLFEGEFGSDEMKEWFIAFIKERSETEVTNLESCSDLSFKFGEEDFYITDNKELEEFINEKCGVEVSIGYYREKYAIQENTMFLTKREAEGYLKANYYHYNSTAHTYAMTAWRSPQVERLYKILQNTNWEEI